MKKYKRKKLFNFGLFVGLSLAILFTVNTLRNNVVLADHCNGPGELTIPYNGELVENQKDHFCQWGPDSPFFGIGEGIDVPLEGGAIPGDLSDRGSGDGGFGRSSHLEESAGIEGFNFEQKFQDCERLFKDKQARIANPGEADFCFRIANTDFVDTCKSQNIATGWLVCLIQTTTDDLLFSTTEKQCADDSRGFIQVFLAVDFSDDGGLNQNPGQGLGDCQEAADVTNGLKEMWTNMRNITNALFIILFVVAIFGHVTGAIEAYTAKKIIPRIVIAAILTQLSWFISTELSAIFDDIGQGISALAQETFDTDNVCLNTILGGGECATDLGSIPGTTPGISGGTRNVGFVVLGTLAGSIIGGFGIIFFAIPVALAVLTAIVTAYFRIVVLIALVIASPIAMTMWALPNTEKWTKTWFTWYMRLLVMYPFVAILIELGKAGAKVVEVENLNDWRNSLWALSAVLIYYSGYAAVPLALKAAITTVANVGGFVNDKSRGVFDRAKNWNKAQRDGRKDLRGEKNLARLGNTKPINPKDLLRGRGGVNAAKRAWYGRGQGFMYSKHGRRQLNQQSQEARGKREQKANTKRLRDDNFSRDQAVQDRWGIKIGALIDDVKDKNSKGIALDADEQAVYDSLGRGGAETSKSRDLARNLIGSGGRNLFARTQNEIKEMGYSRFNDDLKTDVSESKLASINASRGKDEQLTQNMIASAFHKNGEEGLEELGLGGHRVYKAEDPDANIIRDKTETLEAEIGSMLNGKRVTAEDHIAAVDSIMQLHTNSQPAMDAIETYMSKEAPSIPSIEKGQGLANRARSTANNASTRSRQNANTLKATQRRIMDKHLGKLLESAPQFVYGGKQRAMETAGITRTVGMTSGGNRNFVFGNGGGKDKLADDAADAKAFKTMLMHYFNSTINSAGRGQIQAGNVEDIITSAKMRRNLDKSDARYISAEEMNYIERFFTHKGGFVGNESDAMDDLAEGGAEFMRSLEEKRGGPTP